MSSPKLACTARLLAVSCRHGSRLSGSSSAWFKRQASDPYVKAAMRDDYRSRSAFKLLEIDDKAKLLLPGHRVLDCGAAPGAWSQVAVQRTNADGKIPKTRIGQVIAVDLNTIEDIPGAMIFELTDFTSGDAHKAILSKLRGHKLNVVLSDMAPNPTGAASVDHIAIVKLFLAAYGFALQHLVQGGCFLGKLFDGSQREKILKIMRRHFTSVKVVKPGASRDESSELFVLARGLKNRPNFDVGVLPKF